MDDGDRSGFDGTERNGRSPADGPPIDRIESVFAVYEVRSEDDQIVYYGDPLTHPERVMRDLWPTFNDRGYDLEFERRHGEYVLVAEPATRGIDGIPWTNVVLLLATVASTLFVGSWWWYPALDPFANPTDLLHAWPFSLAILGVLMVHEMGHYVMSRFHRVEASLPYFIPIPTLIGTMGAVIRMKGRMPDRKALFDIGVAGPLAGLVATVVVSVIGLHLPPVTVDPALLQNPDAVRIELGYPPLLELLAAAFDQPLYRDDPTTGVNPVVIGAWVGMFVTFLNLIPVGQLDGGHILRAMTGEFHDTVAALVPGALFVLAGYLYYVQEYTVNAVSVWIIWGLLTTVFASAGAATPIRDDRLGTGRTVLGVVTFGLGLLCFMPVPVMVIG
ncbi:site-2 protease family protein [Natrinema thermotolerans]